MLIEQIMTIPVDYLDMCVGKISDSNILNSICKAIEVQFPIMQLASMCC